MQVRKITAEESVQVGMLQSIAFVYPYDVEAERKKVAEDPDSVYYQNTWGCFNDEGKVVGALVNHAYSMYYDGHVVGMSGIGGVASAPESRMRGSIRSIFTKVFEDDKARGVVFSVLFPFSHTYYRQFGYEITHEGRCFKFPTQALRKFTMRGTARMIDASEGEAPFRAIYEQYAGGYNYAVARGEQAWKGFLRGDPYKAQAYRYVLSRDGQDVSYCMFRAERISEHALLLRMYDYAYVDREALYDLLGFLFKLAAQFETIRIEVPDDFELSALIDEPYDVQPDSFVRTMARVIDVETALRLMRHPAGEGQYALRIADDFLPENSGVYCVQYGPDGVQIARSEAESCDLSLSVQTLAQLCLGYMPLSMALLKQDVMLYGNRETLEKVFVKKPMFMTDRF